jgi:hypothetical protein
MNPYVRLNLWLGVIDGTASIVFAALGYYLAAGIAAVGAAFCLAVWKACSEKE